MVSSMVIMDNIGELMDQSMLPLNTIKLRSIKNSVIGHPATKRRLASVDASTFIQSLLNCVKTNNSVAQLDFESVYDNKDGVLDNSIQATIILSALARGKISHFIHMRSNY